MATHSFLFVVDVVVETEDGLEFPLDNVESRSLAMSVAEGYMEAGVPEPLVDLSEIVKDRGGPLVERFVAAGFDLAEGYREAPSRADAAVEALDDLCVTASVRVRDVGRGS